MKTWTIVAVAALACAAAATAATSPKPSLTAYRTCLKKHGVSFSSSAKKPSAAKLRTAFKACASLAPAATSTAAAGGFRQSAAFKKYAACLSKHGVKVTPGKRPSGANFAAAQKACASLRPAGGPNSA